MIYNIIAIIVCVILPFVLLKKELNIKDKNLKSIIKENKYIIIIYSILMVGMLVRLVNIENIPYGFGGDEASEGYEAYSLLNYRCDRHLKSFPIHFISWGSGQNALYAYIDIPFIAVLGLTEIAVRLPMALLGCLTLICMYLFFNKYTTRKITTIMLTAIAICPWHIMKSRWALESNIFPDLILLSSMLLYIGVTDRKKVCWLIGLVIIGLSTYSYGTSYFFVPVFLAILLITLCIKKKIKIWQAIVSYCVVGIIALPLMVFILINNLNLPEIDLGIITIPRLTANRYQEISSVFSKDFLTDSLNNFINSIKMIITENDGMQSNRIERFGLFYKFGIIFIVIGLIDSINNKKDELSEINWYFTSMFATGILLMFVCDPNINRLNIVMIPLIYYIAIGGYRVTEKFDKSIYIFALLYFILFGWFILSYFNIIERQPYCFEHDIKEAVQYVSTLNDKEIYVYSDRIDTYIYYLFYSKEDPKVFCDTVEYSTNGANWERVKKYKNYNFYIPEEMKNEKNLVYVIPSENKFNINYDEWKTSYYGRFIVLEGKD